MYATDLRSVCELSLSGSNYYSIDNYDAKHFPHTMDNASIVWGKIYLFFFVINMS